MVYDDRTITDKSDKSGEEDENGLFKEDEGD
jgi:hypothetical protein